MNWYLPRAPFLLVATAASAGLRWPVSEWAIASKSIGRGSVVSGKYPEQQPEACWFEDWVDCIWAIVEAR